jgi:hypothetical protein
VDVGRAINYVFQDPDWVKKIAIGGVLLLLPVVGWLIVSGYYMRNARNVALGDDSRLPEWNDFGGDLVRGALYFVTGIVWALPVIVISVCVVVPLSLASNNDGGTSGLAILSQCLIAPFSLALAFVQPLIVTRLALTGTIASALDFRAIYDEARRVPVPLLIVMAVSWVLGIAAGLGLILLCIGVIFTAFLAQVMMSHLWGQVRRLVELPATPTTPISRPLI